MKTSDPNHALLFAAAKPDFDRFVPPKFLGPSFDFTGSVPDFWMFRLLFGVSHARAAFWPTASSTYAPMIVEGSPVVEDGRWTKSPDEIRSVVFSVRFTAFFLMLGFMIRLRGFGGAA